MNKLLIFAILCSAPHNLDGPLAAASDLKNASCGPYSLYILSSLLRESPIDYRDITQALLSPERSSLSLHELKTAARACGLKLRGVRIEHWDARITQPMIVYVQRPPNGHYLVIRPVGHTGKLAQVIDYPNDPYVTDFTELAASNEWTGLALIPDRTCRSRLTWSLVITLASIASIIVLFLWRQVKITRVTMSSVGTAKSPG